MTDHSSVRSLAASESVKVDGRTIDVGSTSLANIARPVVLAFGPLSLTATPTEAIALGDALIRMAHHYTAALAEYQAATAVQS